ncbi:hypothetical protein Dimus_031987, partial [Dionaea muscipula]
TWVRRKLCFEENVDATQKSEAVAAKEKSKPRIQRKRRKDVISPGVGENLVDEDVEDKEERGLVVRKRRRLKKATSEEEAAAEDLNLMRTSKGLLLIQTCIERNGQRRNIRSKWLGLSHPRGQENRSPPCV